jgi:hypothetical protein
MPRRKQLGQVDLKQELTKKVSVGKFAVPMFVIAAGAWFVLYKLFQSWGSSGAGEAGDAPEVPSPSGDCRGIDSQLGTPKGCGTVKVTGYSKGSAYPIQISELPQQPGFYAQSYPTNAWAAFQRLYEAAKKAGFTLRVNSSFRTMAKQVKLRKENCAGGAPTGRYVPCKPFTAQAGFSNHQEGTAFDIQVGGMGTPVWKWLRANAGRFGFVDNGGVYGRPGYEPWHWSYKKELDQYSARGVV